MGFEMLFKEGKTCFENGAFLEAIKYLNEALIFDATQEACYFYIAKSYENLKYEAKAIEYYEKGLKMCFNAEYISDYHLNMGCCCIMLSQLETALVHFEESEKHSENYLASQYNKAIVYTCQKEYEKAKILFEEVWKNGMQTKTVERYLTYCSRRRTKDVGTVR